MLSVLWRINIQMMNNLQMSNRNIINQDLHVSPPYNKHVLPAVYFRIILAPIIFLWGLFLLIAGTLFPLPFLVMISFLGLLLEPVIWLLKKSGSNISGIKPFIDNTKNDALGHFLGLTIYIWGAIAIVYVYLKDGTVWTGE